MSEPFALKLIQRLSFLRRVAQLVRQNAYAFPVRCAQSVLSMRSLMMSGLEFGAVYQNVNVAA
jgi:hypothetical protein